MIRFAADENFNNNILRGLKLRFPDIDIVRIQDTEIYQAVDSVVLEWTANAARVLLTHDKATMPDAFYKRLGGGFAVSGVMITDSELGSIGTVINDLSLFIEIDDPSEWEGRLRYLPLK